MSTKKQYQLRLAQEFNATFIVDHAIADAHWLTLIDQYNNPVIAQGLLEHYRGNTCSVVLHFMAIEAFRQRLSAPSFIDAFPHPVCRSVAGIELVHVDAIDMHHLPLEIVRVSDVSDPLVRASS
ncbi:hypothetical protein DTO96_102548 [Ephemeroptericola cinctiostellae]|uniref:Uncharacterized protein n=1 Tax=Ephemeroptericola cinctiostellae TaxID=2268024 RepID=A0A345DEK4_9BURK|nr:hypothetical protein [Ephemeroptericola cinctiostellae]AXF86792.1 hypothetical protein DTO96_102548 [Ephemeroptericola cinctiostellae]